ncbi:phage holin family protein [Sphingobacterium yanglingense]|uniref:Uncharacterized protein n=1 Tax=Sphingobacterium yanglingense TaxID=1437280 RepID=A0A4R6WCK4_9SPHI|nr:phage holin family protein [Sphingobacterium yanglingense]TDQ75474.1 hypothetical protein CLV99_4079 [Sphingobacterium yanglingense]
MSEQNFSFSGSFQKAKEYVDTQVELLKLKTIARMGRVIGTLVLDATKLLLTLIVVFFLSLALGFFLGELLGSNALGFLVTGAVFFVILLVIRAFEPKLEAKFMDLTIRRVLGKWQEDEELFEESQQSKDSPDEGNTLDGQHTQWDNKAI